MAYKIMVVDDEPANLRLLERLFRRDYQVVAASSGAEALRLLEQHDVALLITDQRMPGMTGIELLGHAARLRPHMVRIILTGYTDVEALVEAINCGQVYRYLTKPWNNEDLRLTAARALEHYEANRGQHELTRVNERLNARLRDTARAFVRTVADALEAKDEYLHGHSRRVGGYAAAVGRRMGLGGQALEQLSLAALLHDIGKIGTPDQVLLKPGPLDEEERAVVRLHAERGARMLSGVPEMEEVAEAVRHHHESYDGTGYPEGLSGEMIPLASRIIHVADAYDAMTSPRPFREARDHEGALRLLDAQAGAQFDPAVVQAFFELEALGEIRRRLAPDSWAGLLGEASFRVCEHDPGFDELLRDVRADPVLAACVLREANTKYTLAPTARLREACERLGAARLNSIVAGKGTRDYAAPALREWWEQSLRAAEAARLIALHTRALDPEEAYTAGLLHDLGEALLCALFPGDTAPLARLVPEERCEREVALFGVDHAQVGQWVLDACGLPRQLGAAVQAHHDAMRINAPAALLLHVADAVARAADTYDVAAVDAFGSDRLALLGLDRARLADIHARAAAGAGLQLAAQD
ncbi:MAG TPA: HD domain-containing phosphohydrolase [Pyrinomonadaceae bacterium]|nr:HD domain-containing phosphohydrolase [Pyrinomonadaceae bacterium]